MPNDAVLAPPPESPVTPESSMDRLVKLYLCQSKYNNVTFFLHRVYTYNSNDFVPLRFLIFIQHNRITSDFIIIYYFYYTKLRIFTFIFHLKASVFLTSGKRPTKVFKHS